LLSQAVFASGTVNITEAVLRQLEESSAASAAP
jgi:Skp family chaperone for outer membrane proteins